MLSDLVLDWMFGPFQAFLNVLPDCGCTPTAQQVADTSLNLGLAATVGSDVAQEAMGMWSGGLGFMFDAPSFVAMLAGMLTIEAAIVVVRCLVWMKKAALV